MLHNLQCSIITCVRGLSGCTHFSALSHKRHNFQKTFIEHKVCFDFHDRFCLQHFSFYEKFSELLS